MEDREADSGGETEAGTIQRDVVRSGVVSIPVTFSVSPKWLKKLTEYKQRKKIAVEYFDTESLELKATEMYIEGFKAKLEKDTSYKGLWTVSFTLKEFLNSFWGETCFKIIRMNVVFLSFVSYIVIERNEIQRGM